MPTPPSEHRYPCENCGAALVFAPGQQALACPYCGHVQQIGPGPGRAPARQTQGGVEADALLREAPATGRALQWDAAHKAPQLAEIPLAEGLRLDEDSALAETVRSLSCPNCGARIDLGSGRHATACPFCATPVVTDTGPARRLKPQGVLPFVVGEDHARAALEDWLKGLWFAPSGLTAYARRNRRMTGVYSPYWTFDADTRSAYRGRRGDWYYETVYVTREVNGRTQQVPTQVRRTRWSRAAGQVARSFNDVLVLASSSLPRRLVDALTPWDLSHLAEYRAEYLSGFQAEFYTVPLAAGHEVARQEMAAVIATDVRRDIGGDEQQIEAIDTRHEAETFKHILLPVWTAAYRYNGRSYRFVVNGQTGRVQGERPWSAWKIAAAVVLALVALAAAWWLAESQGWIVTGAAPGAGMALPPVLLPDTGDFRLPEPGGGFVIYGY